MSDTPLQEHLRAYKQRTGMSYRQISIRAGLNSKAVENILAGKSKSPRGDTLAGIASVLKKTLDELSKPPSQDDYTTAVHAEPGTGSAEASGYPAEVHAGPSETDTDTGPNVRHGGGTISGGGDVQGSGLCTTPIVPPEDFLPVFGAAEGGNDGMLVTPEPIDRIRRPHSVLNAKDAFAVYIVGDSMEPRIEHGEMVVVNPKKPFKRRDDVVLVREQEDGTWHALCKRLLRWTNDTWFVKQYNPEKEFELSRSEWPKAYVVASRENA